jgi:hypothetical protein
MCGISGDGAAFLEDLILPTSAQAETYIFLEYYILAEGEIWNRIFSRAAGAGRRRGRGAHHL